MLLAVAGFFAKEVVGDAARYLRPAAQNIQRRHEIRSAGVAALEKLHGRGYDRIVVVGHSLGAVIGYDVLSHAFGKFNVVHEPVHAEEKALRALEALARAGDAAPRDVQDAQRAYFEELVANGGLWRVTDFITLGSPLAHSAVLLAEDRKGLEGKITQREYPTCLPELEQKIRSEDPEERYFSYVRPPAGTSGLEIAVPHHAAVFAPTRWTNLYFPCKRILFGDVIGGPVAPVLGSGVLDRPVGTARRSGWLSHGAYWRQTDWRPGSEAQPEQEEATRALRSALDLLDRRAGAAATDPVSA